MVLPAPTPVANPPVVIVATPVFDEVQVTEPVMSCVVPSLNVTVALNCVVSPLAMVRLLVVTEIDWTVGAPEEEQLPRTRMEQTQRRAKHILRCDPKYTPHVVVECCGDVLL